MEKKKRKKVRKPSFFVYYILGPLIVLFAKLRYGMRNRGDKMPKGPTLIIGPHRTYYDFLTLPIAIWPKRGLIVSTTYWYRNKWLGRLINWIGTIPKDQYKSDLKAIMKMGEAFKSGQNVLIFPEGQMSMYGTSLVLPNGLDKLISMFKPNVYFVNTNGAYFSSPKWNNKPGRCHIINDRKVIITSEEAKTLSVKEINERLNAAFKSNNDFEWYRSNPKYKFKNKKKAYGLGNVLMHCPSCRESLSFTSEKHTAKCSCGYTLELDKNNYNLVGNSEFRDLGDFFNWDLSELKKEIDNGLELNDVARVTYYEGLEEVELSLSDVKMNFDTFEIIPRDVTKEPVILETKKIINFVITINRSFEVPTSLRTYRIYPNDPKRCTLYWNYMNILKEKNESNS